MNRFKILLVIAIAFLSTSVKSQNDITTVNYFINPYVLNPAFAGSQEGHSLFFDIRREMAGLDQGPGAQYFSYDWDALPNKIGVGLQFRNNTSGILSEHKGYASFSYRAPIAEDHYFNFGLNAGIAYRGLDFSRVQAKHPNEAVLNSSNRYSSVFDGSLGALYKLKKLEVGLTVDHLTAPQFGYSNNIDKEDYTSTLQRRYTGTVAYRISRIENFEILPMVVVRSAQGVSAKFEGGAAAYYKNSIWLSALYKHNSSFNLSAGFLDVQRLSFGYSYHYYFSRLNQLSYGSHELVLGIRFTKQNKKQPISNAMNSSDEEKARMQEKLDILEEKRIQQQKEIDRLKKEAKKRKLKEEVQGLNEIKEQPSQAPDSIAEVKSTVEIPLEEVPTEEQVKEVSDVETGEYKVILGAFQTLDKTVELQKIIKREYGISTLIAKNRLSKAYPYLIYSKGCDNREECAEELQKMQLIDTKDIIVGNPWLYKSHK